MTTTRRIRTRRCGKSKRGFKRKSMHWKSDYLRFNAESRDGPDILEPLLRSEPMPEDEDELYLPGLDAVELALCEVSLLQFLQKVWHTVEPKEFVSGFHIEAICDHLEAMANLQIRKLIINIPPRYMKSLGCSVFFCPWIWLKDPSKRFMYASYAQTLSIRDSRKSRLVIQSKEYQRMILSKYPDFKFSGDQNAKMRFDNTYNGYRIATSVGGMTTGEGGDFNIIDDPHNVVDGESDAKRLEALLWIDEAMSTRRDSPEETAYLLIMQRIHENDMTGHLLAKEAGWEHLCLPHRYEGMNRCHTSLNFKDPRKKEGELLWPTHWTEAATKDVEAEMSQYAIAAQLYQRPSPRGGGMIPISKFNFAHIIDRTKIVSSVRYWDKAATEAGGKRTAGVLMHKMSNGRFLIEDIVKGQWSTGNREARIEQVATLDASRTVARVEQIGKPARKVPVKIWIEQEPGSGGKESAENTITRLAGFVVHADRVTGAKEDRAEPFAVQVEHGMVDLYIPQNKKGNLKDTWVGGDDGFLHECELFPMGKFSDQVDAASGAFNKLTGKKKIARTWGTRKNKGVVRRRRQRGKVTSVAQA